MFIWEFSSSALCELVGLVTFSESNVEKKEYENIENKEYENTEWCIVKIK